MDLPYIEMTYPDQEDWPTCRIVGQGRLTRDQLRLLMDRVQEHLRQTEDVVRWKQSSVARNRRKFALEA